MQSIQIQSCRLLRGNYFLGNMYLAGCVGRGFIGLARSAGAFVIFVFSVFGALFSFFGSFRLYWSQLVRAIVEDCFFSLFIVAIASTFVGSILVLQIYGGFSAQYIEGAVAKILTIAVIKDLAPVFVGFLLAGKIGTAVASKIATMKLTEQLEALQTLSVSIMNYIVVPKLLATVIAFFFCYICSTVFGILGGYIVAHSLGFNVNAYVVSTYQFANYGDILIGLSKALLFGIIVSLLGCYFGLNSGRCSQGVGAASTKAVVASTVWILIVNYLVNWVSVNV